MLLLLAPFAAAHELSGDAWPQSAFPLEIHWTGELDSMTRFELEEAVEASVNAWQEAMPCGMEVILVEDPLAGVWFDEGGGSAILIGDPFDELEESVFFVAEQGTRSGETFAWNDATWEEAPPYRIVVNDGAPVVSDDAIRHDDCDAQWSLQGLLMHAIGQSLGLADSCSDGEECTDPDATEATMYWSQAACDTTASTLNADDRDGITAIYGDTYDIDVTCTAADDPMEADCLARWTESIDEWTPTWEFGDGGTGVGVRSSHTYGQEGVFDVAFCLEPPTCDSPRCLYTSFEAVESADTDTDTDADTDADADTDTDTDADTDADTDTGAPAEDGCGCDHAPSGVPVLGLLALFGLRRRRWSRLEG